MMQGTCELSLQLRHKHQELVSRVHIVYLSMRSSSGIAPDTTTCSALGNTKLLTFEVCSLLLFLVRLTSEWCVAFACLTLHFPILHLYL